MANWSEQQYNRHFPYGVDSINAKRFNNPGPYDNLSDKELFKEVIRLEYELEAAKKALEDRRKYDDYDGDPTNDIAESRSPTGIDNPADFLKFNDITEDDDIII